MIKVLIPNMPLTSELLPYLQRIDDRQIYTNHGPLVQELEARLSDRLQCPCVVVANGTLALELALKALREVEAHTPNSTSTSWVRVPSVTFAASGLAVRNAGLKVRVCDVNPLTFQLDMKSPAAYMSGCAHMPVAAFGLPVAMAAWEAQADLTGEAVIVDAAGVFGDQAVSFNPNIITCFSMHATKIFGAGEGGIVCSTEPAILEAVRSLRNFGELPGSTNAKLSEYHAAVALASLDMLHETHADFQTMREWYGKALHPFSRSAPQFYFGTSMLNVLLDRPALQVQEQLAERGIETKRWYVPYLHERSDFGSFLNTHSALIAESMLGLPYHVFLERSEVEFICKTLREILV